MRRRRLGFLVNPIAGMGGAVGLKGTDGPALAEALRRGAQPSSPRRAADALQELAPIAAALDVMTVDGAMGANVAEAAHFSAVSIHFGTGYACTAEDTRRAVEAMRDRGVDLILFAGGDGTARDVFAAVGTTIPILGIPAGVKMHSAVFATSPRNAGRLATSFLTGDAELRLRDAEIMDREGAEGEARLFGYARTPYARLLVQPAKAAAPNLEEAELDAACRQVARLCTDDRYSFIGPGTTMRRIKRLLGAESTLLGVDVFRAGRVVALDVGEAELLTFMEERAARIVLGIVGGQGYLFGRGNQQLSARVIERVGKADIVIVATVGKLVSLEAQCLFVDTGDEAVDRMLSGYVSVLTGPDRRAMFKVAQP